ncbi:MAG: adenosylcobinamide-GDP ribazoletransferase [Devosiaceae bacterium]|nr:adenosylcobinamide-GDP ribazoletransferase [Devosiaceae bacterium]
MSRRDVGNDIDDNSTKSNAPPTLKGDILMGLQFFSRLPTSNNTHQPPHMGRMVPVLGLSSVIIGVAPALVFLGLGMLGLPILLAACFGIGAQAIVGGAMSEDGLADSVDGLWGGHSRAQRLTIMKDSRQGTYGVLALIFLTTIRILALGSLASISLIGAAMLWIAAQVIARQSALWLTISLEPARLEGAAKSTGKPDTKAFWTGALIATLIVSVFAGAFVGLPGLLVAGLVMALIVFFWTRLCKNLIGGYSGDLIGALHALVEIGVLCAFIIVI